MIYGLVGLGIGIIIVVAWEIMYFHKNTKNKQ